ncbi:MAG: reverse transcriptase domain-containing protein, partial [Bacteroidota bacterium]
GSVIGASKFSHAIRDPTSHSTLKFLLCNARSIGNKIQVLQTALKSGESDVLCLSETWLHFNIPDSLIVHGTKFDIYRKDRGKRGGGVAICILKSLKCASVEVPFEVECVCLDVDGKDTKFRIACIYNPPSTSDVTSLCECFQYLSRTSRNLIIVGDFNFPKIEWAANRASSKIADQFLSKVLELGLYQLVKFPTRLGAVLDLVFCSEETELSNVQVAEPLSVGCDHDSVSFQCSWENIEETEESYRDFRRGDYAKITEYLLQIDWGSELDSCVSVDEFWKRFLFHCSVCIEAYIPLRIISSKSRYKLPQGLRKLRARKRKIFQRMRVYKSESVRIQYRKAQMDYRIAAREFFREKERGAISSGNPNNIYRLIREKTGGKRKIGIIRSGEESISDPQEKVELFNQYFSSVFTKDDGKTFISDPAQNRSVLSEVYVTPLVVQGALKRLKPKFSTGADGIPPIFLKNLHEVLCIPLSLLFNFSLDMRKVPSEWKESDIIPVFKKGDRKSVKNYRPVSMTSAVCRVMERILCRRMSLFYEKRKFFTDFQYGFRSGRSVTTQMLMCLNEWTDWLDRRQCFDVVFVDFQKAFDSVCHSKLLSILKDTGIEGKLYDWFSDFLSERKQRVKIEDCLSGWKDVVSGVPQGSGSGYLLFLVFINSLWSKLNECGVRVFLFADDVQLYSKDSSAIEMALKQLEQWCEKYQLRIAPNKTHVMHFGKKNKKRRYQVNGVWIDEISVHQDLGIHITPKLDFSHHCTMIAAKGKRRMAMLGRAFNYCNASLLTKAYIVYVRPIVESCSQVWSPCWKKDKKKIESVQRFATRLIFKKCNISGRTYEERLKYLKLQKLEDRRKESDLSLCYKLYHGDAFDDGILRKTDPRYALRSGAQLRYQYSTPSTMTIRQNYFGNRVVQSWNDLCEDTKKASNVAKFKLNLQTVSDSGGESTQLSATDD